jgi:phasin family protein
MPDDTTNNKNFTNPFAAFTPATFAGNPFANSNFAKNMQEGVDGFMKWFAPNASGPFGIPTFNPASEKLDKEFSWAFDPQFTMKNMDMSALKDMFPTDFMKSWQDMFQNTFQNFSMGNMAELTKMPKLDGVDWQALMESQKKNMEACAAAHLTMRDSWQQLAKRQGEIFRETLQAVAKLTTDLMETGTPEEKMARQVDIAKQAYDILGKHMREFATASANGQAEALDLVSARVQASLDELKENALKAEKAFSAASRQADKAAG